MKKSKVIGKDAPGASKSENSAKKLRRDVEVVEDPSSNVSSDDDDDVTIFKPSSREKTSASIRDAAHVRDVEVCATPSQKATSVTSTATFKNLGLDDWICENLNKVAISRPTPVQVACIPPILKGVKVLSASAPTGSGKTAAFALPILDRLARDPYGIFALVLTPTRELALQIGEQFSTHGAPVGARCEVVIGGLPIIQQQLALAKMPHVVVATPGRFAAHVLGADPPRMDRLRFLVLDESDRLLTPGEGFYNDLKRISERLKGVAPRLHTLLFSATSGGKKDVATVHELGLACQREPEFQWDYASSSETVFGNESAGNVETGTVVKLIPSTLSQTLSLVPSQAKHAYLTWFLKSFAPSKVVDVSKLTSVSLKDTKPATGEGERAKSMIIFTSTCEQCQIYSEMLNQLQISCVAIHAELPQKKRMDNLVKFRSGQMSILLATDVASRGLDIPQVDVVLNLDVPREVENYVHRIGRCARAGRLGRSFLFVTQNEVSMVKAIEAYTKQRLETFEIDDEKVAGVLHKASVAKRKAVLRLHDDGFLERIKVRKERRQNKHKKDKAVESDGDADE